MVTDASPATEEIRWSRAVRIIRSLHPPIDLFEDIADPADWGLILSAEMKTNPRLATSVGQLDLVPESRRVGGPGASWLMAPFVHASPDRPSRFSDGSYGVLYAARTFETALFETMHHHALFMARTAEKPGWTSQFLEILIDVAAPLVAVAAHADAAALLDRDDYVAAQSFGAHLRQTGHEGLVYPSVRHDGGLCCGLFHPDLASRPVRGRPLDYHYDGERVDFVREGPAGKVFRVTTT